MAPVWTKEQPATTEVHKVADEVKSDAKSHIHALEQIFVAKTYREQDQTIMLGKLLLIKVDIGNPNNFVHMEVFVPSNKLPVLVAIQENYKNCDPLQPLV
ncbi:cystatin-B-like isoform X2 [Hemitrygon akajei]|uniref:cystatin-B-like isoform X2 n=1 Tax=Hemitrygon akajei TaxID=2704970 RepID=UPI003BF9CBB8